MYGVSGVSSASYPSVAPSSSSAQSLMSVVEEGMEDQTNLASKFVKISAEQKLQQQQMSMLGQVVDMYV